VSTIYSSPEKYGLTTVGEIDYSDGCYQFDLTVVWRDAHGRLFYGDDSGCSCPSPFEDMGLTDLTVCTFATLQEHLEDRLDEAYSPLNEWDRDDRKNRAAQIVNLLGRVRNL
jgi:hypothetical protein